MYSSSTILVAMLLVSACAFDGSNTSVAADPGNTVDASDGDPSNTDAIAASPDAESGCQNFATHFDACAIDPENDDELNLNDVGEYTYDTATGILLDPARNDVPHTSALVLAAQGDIRVVITTTFSVGRDAVLRAVGSIPLAIGAFDSLTIGGVIDVSRGGAGARGLCGTSNGSNGGNENGGGGGGGGGAFRGQGGDGGLGNGDGGNQGAVGPGGMATNIPTSPLGGCPGGDGGRGEDPGGNRGVGGGAITLAAGTQITISGGIQAGGAGGQGGREGGMGFGDAGGGGGGSGGYIFVEAPALKISGIVAANGGSGGEGSGNRQQGRNGNGGVFGNVPAIGGTGGSSTGSDGANGSAADTLAGGTVMVSEDGGAGGGGGGAGFILFTSADRDISGAISPASM